MSAPMDTTGDNEPAATDSSAAIDPAVPAEPSPSFTSDLAAGADESDVVPESVAAAEPIAALTMPGDDIDLDAIARDLDAVNAALGRLDDNSYGIDTATGLMIDDAVLAADPTATRAP